MGWKRPILLAATAAVVASAALSEGCSHGASKAKAREDANIANLKELRLALWYSVGDGDHFPLGFDELVRGLPPELVKPEFFVSPETGHRPGSLNSIKRWTDYIYVGGLHDEFILGVPLVISPPENHGGKCGYVIWSDGTAAQVPVDRIRKLIADPFCMDTFNVHEDVDAERRRIIIQVPERFGKEYEDPNLARLNELGAVLRLLARARYPSSFQDVAAEMPPEMLNPEIFILPGPGHKTGVLNAVEVWTDFIYVSGLDNELLSGVPLVISPPENHEGKCGYVVWTDGGATRLSAENTRELIADPFSMARFEVAADQVKRMQLEIPGRLKRYYGKKAGLAK